MKDKTLEIMDKLKNVDVDIEATIENAFLGDCGDKTLAISPIVDNIWTPFRDYGDDFDSKILEDLDDEGIYVSLAYVQNEDVDNDLDSAICDLSSDDVDFDYIGFYEVRTEKETKIFATDKDVPCDICADYGVKISKTSDGYKVEFAIHSGGPTCWSTPSISFFNDEPNDRWVDINNSLNQLLVDMMFKCIVLK